MCMYVHMHVVSCTWPCMPCACGYESALMCTCVLDACSVCVCVGGGCCVD